MSATKWLGLWAQERQGFYAGQTIKKADIPKYTRIVLRYNKFYEKDSNRPRFVYCFADSKEYKSKCVPIEIVDNMDEERLYTEEEVYQIIHGIQEHHGLPYGEDLIEDFI